MTRPAQLQRRVLGYMRKPLKLHLLSAKESKRCMFWRRFLAWAKNRVPVPSVLSTRITLFFYSIKVNDTSSSIRIERVSLSIAVMLSDHKT